ncbi:MAG: hypothetical protein ACHRXM_12970 [Isosphaerales bacterium]
MQTIKLSKDARNLLRLASRQHVEVTPENLEAYRELARAGVMVPLSGFMRGPEAVFRFTEEGWNMREELQRPSRRFTPSAMLRRIRRAFTPISKSVSGAR